MSVQYYLNIDGIDGECADKDHKGWISVQSFSFTATQPIGRFAASAGGGGAAERVDMQDFLLTMISGKATPPLLQACASGKHIKEVVLECRTDKENILRWTLSEVIISSYHIGGVFESGQLATDQIALNFAAIKVAYTTQDRDGAAAGATEGGWDLTSNKPWT